MLKQTLKQNIMKKIEKAKEIIRIILAVAVIALLIIANLNR